MIDLQHKLEVLQNEVGREVLNAMSLFPKINNMHEGLGVLMEEFDEFKTEVYAFNLRKGRDTRAKAKAELLQVAAMALRTILDCEL